MKTSEQIIKDSGLDWKVYQRPVEWSGHDGKYYCHPDKRVNLRSDNHKPLGIVGSGYKVVQNSTVFAFLDSLLGNQIESFVRAYAWKDGAKVSIRAKLPGDLIFANNPDDKGIKYVDFFTSHDGSMALEARILAYRLVCSNGLMGFRKILGSKIRHTKTANLEYLRKQLGLLNEKFDILQEYSKKLAERPFPKSHLSELLKSVGIITDESKTRGNNILQEIENLFEVGKGTNLKNTKGTAWGAYNAVTEYVDHYRGTDQNREESSLLGSGALIKQKVMEALVS